jgi:hypothetical protein
LGGGSGARRVLRAITESPPLPQSRYLDPSLWFCFIWYSDRFALRVRFGAHIRKAGRGARGQASANRQAPRPRPSTKHQAPSQGNWSAFFFLGEWRVPPPLLRPPAAKRIKATPVRVHVRCRCRRAQRRCAQAPKPARYSGRVLGKPGAPVAEIANANTPVQFFIARACAYYLCVAAQFSPRQRSAHVGASPSPSPPRSPAAQAVAVGAGGRRQGARRAAPKGMWPAAEPPTPWGVSRVQGGCALFFSALRAVRRWWWAVGTAFAAAALLAAWPGPDCVVPHGPSRGTAHLAQGTRAGVCARGAAA